MYMLDTNVLIYAMRHPRDKLVQKLIDHAGGDICISTITLAELELGIMRSSNPLKNRQSLMAVLSGIDILQFDNAAATEFAAIKDRLLRAGTPIEDMVILIAAHAKSLDYTLVSENVRHMERIDGLCVENWVERCEL